MRGITANTSTEGIIFLVLAVVWAIVQVIQRVARPSSPSPQRGKPPTPTNKPGSPPRPARPASSPEDDLRRFFEELAGSKPEPEPQAPPPLPPPVRTPEPVRAPQPVQAPVTARRSKAIPAAPAARTARRIEFKPAQPAPRFVSEARPRIDEIAESIQDLPDAPFPTFAPLQMTMRSLPTIRMGGGSGYSGTPRKARGHILLRPGDRTELRRAVLLATMLGPPRAFVPVGHELPQRD